MTADCPGCGEWGDHYEEDQYECNNPTCRVVIYHNHGQTGL
mgnify:FL=1